MNPKITPHEPEEELVSSVEEIFRDVEESDKRFILHLSERISAFKSECEGFERKYSMNFQLFERKLSQKINEEDFAEEDDYTAWKFAEESRIFLQNKLADIV